MAEIHNEVTGPFEKFKLNDMLEKKYNCRKFNYLSCYGQMRRVVLIIATG